MEFDHLLFAWLLVQKQARTLYTTWKSAQIILLSWYIHLSSHPIQMFNYCLFQNSGTQAGFQRSWRCSACTQWMKVKMGHKLLWRMLIAMWLYPFQHKQSTPCCTKLLNESSYLGSFLFVNKPAPFTGLSSSRVNSHSGLTLMLLRFIPCSGCACTECFHLCFCTYQL